MVDFLKNMHPDLETFEDESIEGSNVDQQYLYGQPYNNLPRHQGNKVSPQYLAEQSYHNMPRSQGSFTVAASEKSPLGRIENAECIVKWFNPVKGYGFVMPRGVNEDIFMHFSVLDAAGYQYLGPGDELLCVVLQGDKGRQVSEIFEVRPARQAPAPYMFGYRQLQPVGPLEEASGEVKWFNTIRGFGFVKADNGGRDIFVHASVLRRIGLQKIYPGQHVKMQVANSDNGRQAWTIELID